MAHSRHRAVNNRRSRNKTVEIEPELFDHDRSSCDCRIEDMPLDIDDHRQIRQVLHFSNGNKLVWFAVLYYKIENDRGSELYSVDTNHGHFHEHTHGHRKRNDRRNIRPLYTQVDVQESFDPGYDLVYEKHLAMTGR